LANPFVNRHRKKYTVKNLTKQADFSRREVDRNLSLWYIYLT
jgi:hypothetical protein